MGIINYSGSGGGIPRKTAVIFAGNATNDDVTAFGSTLAGATVKTKDLSQIQNASFQAGWRNAVISNKNYPLLADMNGVLLAATQQIAGVLQHGICQYDSNTTYYTYDLVNQNGVIYISTQDENIDNPPSNNSEYWAIFYDPTLMDGQWRPLNVTAIDGQTYPTTIDIDISLNSILPNDGYNYELLVSATGGTANQGEITRVFIKSSIITNPIGLCEIKSPTNATMYCYGSAAIPIGTDRKLTVVRYTATTNVGTYYLYFRGYRRLGTNI